MSQEKESEYGSIDADADIVISNAETKTSQEREKWFSLSEALEAKKMKVTNHMVYLQGGTIKHSFKVGTESSLTELESENGILTKRSKLTVFPFMKKPWVQKSENLAEFLHMEQTYVQGSHADMYKSYRIHLKITKDKRKLAKAEQKLFDDVQMLKQYHSAVEASNLKLI
ncbi:hypothetical protein Tco_0765008 [Tanacetum coccineum]